MKLKKNCCKESSGAGTCFVGEGGDRKYKI